MKANTQHVATNFKCPVTSDLIAARDKWGPLAMKHLAQMVNSFPDAKQFHQLNDPLKNCEWLTIDGPCVCIREYITFLPEKWSEPNELADDDFKPRLLHKDSYRTVFEVVFKFDLRHEYPETD